MNANEPRSAFNEQNTGEIIKDPVGRDRETEMLKFPPRTPQTLSLLQVRVALKTIKTTS